MSGGIYLRNKGFVTGPFSRQQALKLVREGKFTRIHEFSTDGDTWRPGCESDFLRETARPPTPAATVPFPGIKVTAASQGGDNDEWYYGNGLERLGPVSPEALADLIQRNSVSKETLVWKAGMDDWKPASTLPQLNPFFIDLNPTRKPRKSRFLAGLLALFLGGLGLHRLYLQDWKGALYPVCLLVVLSPKLMGPISDASILAPYEKYSFPAAFAILLLTLIESYYLWCMTDEKWRRKWSGR